MTLPDTVAPSWPNAADENKASNATKADDFTGALLGIAREAFEQRHELITAFFIGQLTLLNFWPLQARSKKCSARTRSGKSPCGRKRAIRSRPCSLNYSGLATTAVAEREVQITIRPEAQHSGASQWVHSALAMLNPGDSNPAMDRQEFGDDSAGRFIARDQKSSAEGAGEALLATSQAPADDSPTARS